MSPTQQLVLQKMTEANIAATDMVFELLPLAAAIVVLMIGIRFVKLIRYAI